MGVGGDGVEGIGIEHQRQGSGQNLGKNGPYRIAAWDARLERCANKLWYGSSAVLSSAAPGWHALIDGKEVPILRIDYVLRALEVAAGKHVIEFKFEPKPYIIGDKITMASSWVLLLVVLGCLRLSLREQKS